MFKSLSFWSRIICFQAGLFVSMGTIGLAADFQGPVNSAVMDKQSVVIIVPTNEQDKDAERSIFESAKSVRKKFFLPETPVMRDTEALQADLSSKTLLVYGTWQGNLWLASSIKRFPIEIHAEKIVTDRSIEGRNLRLISVWPNPQNPEKGTVIYTAQQSRDVVNINTVFHGPTDFVVAGGEKVLEAGNYYKGIDWRLPSDSRFIPLDAALGDLDFFFKTVEAVHPNPLASISAEEYSKLMRETREGLTQAAGEKKEVPKSILARAIARAAAFLGDGHTSSFLHDDLLDRRDPAPVMLPFLMELDCGRIVMGNTTKELEPVRGLQLLKIDDVETVDVLGPVLALISGERADYKLSSFMNVQKTYWSLVRPIRKTEVSVVLKDKDGRLLNRTIKLISLADYESSVGDSGQKKAFVEGPQYYDDGRTCYWPYNSCDNSESARLRIDQLFRELQEKKTENLIIDLRHNGGGNSNAAGYILDHLAARPYRIYSRVDRKISTQSLALLGGGDDKEHVGQIVTYHNEEYHQPMKSGDRFNGRVFMLTGLRTFSAAANFAAVVKDYGIGILLGEETGGQRQGFGDILSFNLPNSGLGFYVSYKCFYAPEPKPGDDRHGTQPDIELTSEWLQPFERMEDPALAFLLDHIKQSGLVSVTP